MIYPRSTLEKGAGKGAKSSKVAFCRIRLGHGRLIRAEFSGRCITCVVRDLRVAIYEDIADRLAFLMVVGDTLRDFN
jgi:hypothetical protein